MVEANAKDPHLFEGGSPEVRAIGGADGAVTVIRLGRPAPARHGGTVIDTTAAGERTGQVDLSGAAALRSVMRIRPFRRLWIVLGVASSATG